MLGAIFESAQDKTTSEQPEPVDDHCRHEQHWLAEWLASRRQLIAIGGALGGFLAAGERPLRHRGRLVEYESALTLHLWGLAKGASLPCATRRGGHLPSYGARTYAPRVSPPCWP